MSVLEPILRRLGLSESEIRVFTCLLQQSSKQRISRIARTVRLNRTTLYGILKSLAERGLVVSVEERGVLAYASIQPHLLIDYVERARENLANDIAKVRATIPSIERMRTKGLRNQPSTQYFHGAEGLKQAYEDTLRDNPEKIIRGFVGTEAVYNSRSVDVDWVQSYVRRRTELGIIGYAVATDSLASHRMKKGDSHEARITKFLPPGYNFDIELITYKNKLLAASFADDNPLAVIIEDEKIAETIRELFRYIDSTLPN